MSKTWFTDNTAFATHLRLKQGIAPFCATYFPNYELTHSGFSQDFDTGEVVIRLHLNPKGSVKCAADIPMIGYEK